MRKKRHISRSGKTMRSLQHVNGVDVFAFPDRVWKVKGWRTRKKGSKKQKGKRFPVGPARTKKFRATVKPLPKLAIPKTVKVVKSKPKKYTYYIMWKNAEGKVGIATTKASSMTEAHENAEKFPLFKEVLDAKHESGYHGFMKPPPLEPKKAKPSPKVEKPKPIEKSKPKQTEKKSKVKIIYHKIKPKKEKERIRTIRLSEESKTMPNREEIEAEAYRMYMMDNPHFDTTPERDELSEEGYLRAAQRNLMSTGKAKDLEDDYINYLKRDLEERGYTIVPMR